MKRKVSAVLMSLLLVIAVAGCSAAEVQAYITLIANIALQVAQLAGLSPAIATTVTNDLAVVNKAISDYNAAPASSRVGLAGVVDTALNTLKLDLGALLSAARVVDANKQAAINTAISIAITAVESLRALALQNAPANVQSAAVKVMKASAPSVLISKPMKPAQLKALYNNAVAAYPQAHLR